MNQFKYMVYGKHSTMTRFAAMDITNMQPVANLIQASYYSEEEKPELTEYVRDLNRMNPDWQFEIREN